MRKIIKMPISRQQLLHHRKIYGVSHNYSPRKEKIFLTNMATMIQQKQNTWFFMRETKLWRECAKWYEEAVQHKKSANIAEYSAVQSVLDTWGCRQAGYKFCACQGFAGSIRTNSNETFTKGQMGSARTRHDNALRGNAENASLSLQSPHALRDQFRRAISLILVVTSLSIHWCNIIR